ncbi:FAD dependent oxidoreductase [Parachaetomium inaequale]|uniref:FAD dependent oxidoreductase n=1 Tax=Parachaetomium inaequale TaxID=2588326 RepID=A0AAN6SKQ0_9PEZI|nr:FAD dependent oxidoreductase [Parachaetomium inaequale]
MPSISTGLPVPHPTRSYWQSVPSALDKHQSVQHLPASCDILIIGGGYAGAATAYHLLKSAASRNTRPSVVLLEARGACSGATGRNGGHLRPDLTSAPVLLSERYGPRAAAAVAQFEMDHLAAIAQFVAEEDVDCDLTEATSFDVFTTPEQAAAARERHDLLRKEPAFAGLLAAVGLYAGDDAPDRTGVRDAKAYFCSPAAHLSPYKLTMGLLSRALELGLCLKTHTPVLSILEDADDASRADEAAAAEDDEDVRVRPRCHRITTPQGAITATKIVVATNAYTAALLPEYAAAIVPCKGLACHIAAASPSSPPLPRLPTSSLCIRVQQGPLSGYTYLVQRADGSVVAGGAHHTYKQTDPASWYGTVDDAGLIEPAWRYYCDGPPGFAARALVGWVPRTRTCVDHVWTGIMGYSADSLPHVGAAPGRDGVFVLAGFHGHGMPVAYLAAKGVAEMVWEGKTYEETGLPAVYKTSQERLMPRYDDILGA